MPHLREFLQTEASRKPHYLVVGHPIGHSLSPLMHGAALAHHGIQAGYHAIDLAPDEVTRFISWMNRDEFLGTNVTIPYKQTLVETVDRLDPTVEMIGALNTIVKRDGELLGYNTDVPGFSYPLGDYREMLEGGLAVVFGTGGASRAVTYALLKLGVSEIVMVSRNPGNLDHSSRPDGFTYCNYSNWQVYGEEAVILVNTTPLGMAPETDQSPVNADEQPLLMGKICYDLVYNPLRTTFLKRAESAGGIPVGGLEMFIRQGEESFRLWTGKRFPMEIIRNMLKPNLS
ncbi:MAG: shikimate dehydrogenase [Balneolaceae bacterium]